MSKEDVDLARQALPAEEYEKFCRLGDLVDHLRECLRTKTPSPHCTATDLEQNLDWCFANLRTYEAMWEDIAQDVIAYIDRINGVTWKCEKCGKQTDRAVANQAGWFVCSSCSE